MSTSSTSSLRALNPQSLRAAFRTSAPAADSGFDLGPVLVSELPPAHPVRPSLVARFRDDLAARRDARQFERAVRYAGPAEYGDLLAARRRG